MRPALKLLPFVLSVLAAASLVACHPMPARLFPVSCPDGEVSVCLGHCVAPAAAGGACTPTRDECAAGFLPCQTGFACQASALFPVSGTCVPVPSLFCDPHQPANSAANLCLPGSYCVPLGTPEAVAAHTACFVTPRLAWPGGTPATGICRRGVGDGQACDSDWLSATGPGPGGLPLCSACAPGLVCLNSICRRTCLPSEGGVGNCIPDLVTATAAIGWNCFGATGTTSPTGASASEPLCTACVAHLTPCAVPPDVLAQTHTGDPAHVCCDPNDVCPPPLHLPFGPVTIPGTCCRPPTFGDVDGGVCTTDADCCPLSANSIFPLVRCCRSADQPGCRASTVGRCGGCGPGTHIPCCRGDSCGDGQTCVGQGDAAQCVPCGGDNMTCCSGDTCDEGLRCFPGFQPLTRQCRVCGGVGQACCPDGSCAAGNSCVDGACQPCGTSGAPCCDGRTCNDSSLRCGGPGAGTCTQFCGGDGLPCCNLPLLGSPDRSNCLDRNLCNRSTHTCHHCGSSGEPPCDTAPICDFGIGLSGGVCGPCGASGLVCCEPGSSEICAAHLGCDPRNNHCADCGGVGQPCCPAVEQCCDSSHSGCPGAACTQPGTCCSSGVCEAPPP